MKFKLGGEIMDV